MRWIASLSLCTLLAFGEVSQACTFCAGSLLTKQTFREYLSASSFAAYGLLDDPQTDPTGLKGTTKLEWKRQFKGEPPTEPTLIIARYLPLIGNTPRDYLIFGSRQNAMIEPTYGTSATPALIDYLNAITKFDEAQTEQRWKFYFEHLDHTDAAVASDAFLEFAKAPDAEITKHKHLYSITRLRKLMTSTSTPPEQLGVFALLFGLAGGTEELNYLEAILKQPWSDRVQQNLSGYLAAMTLIDSKRGWSRIEQIILDPKQEFPDRLAAISAMHYFQTVHQQEHESRLILLLEKMLIKPEIADIAIEDLRRMEQWRFTDLVLDFWTQPTHKSRLIRRAIVHYALTCPREVCKSFLAEARKSEPRLVSTVEEILQIEAENKP